MANSEFINALNSIDENFEAMENKHLENNFLENLTQEEFEAYVEERIELEANNR